MSLVRVPCSSVANGGAWPPPPDITDSHIGAEACPGRWSRSAALTSGRERGCGGDDLAGLGGAEDRAHRDREVRAGGLGGAREVLAVVVGVHRGLQVGREAVVGAGADARVLE